MFAGMATTPDDQVVSLTVVSATVFECDKVLWNLRSQYT